MNFYDDIEKYGGAIALFAEDHESISYQELTRQADAFARTITGRCLVFNLCDNNVESIIGYIGSLRNQVVPFLVNNGINPSLFETLLNLYQPSYIWAFRGNKVIEGKGTEVYACKNYVLLKTTFNPGYSIHADLALLLTTSGSTGSPKLVRQSYKNIIANTASITEYLKITERDCSITTLPMSYTFGLSIINSHLLMGGSIVLTNRTLIDKVFWQLMKEKNITSFSGVPYIYEMLKRLGFSRMNFPGLKTLTQAGGKLSQSLTEEFAKICAQKAIDFMVMYGQTEATARMSYLPPEYALSKAGSIGIAIPGGEFWLENENGDIIKESDTMGELVYKGENVSMGYAQNCLDLSKGDENAGILKTGDLARRDKDGFYYIVGRNKRFLKLFGNRINLNEVEQLLNDKGYHCVCAGIDNHLKIYITNDGIQNEVKAFISELTGITPSAFTVTHIAEIPRNEYGKILYAQLD